MSSNTAYLIPAPGRMVRIPYSNAHLPAGGGYVELTAYWRRRMSCGDVLQTSSPALLAARAQVEAMAEAMRVELQAARQAGTREAAIEAMQRYAGKVQSEIVGPADELAKGMSESEIEAVEAYAAALIEPMRSELETMIEAAPSAPPAPAAVADDGQAKGKGKSKAK